MKNRIISFLCAFVIATLSFCPSVVYADTEDPMDVLEIITSDKSTVYIQKTVTEDDDGNKIPTYYEVVLDVDEDIKDYLNDDGIITVNEQMYALKVTAMREEDGKDSVPIDLSGNSVGIQENDRLGAFFKKRACIASITKFLVC